MNNPNRPNYEQLFTDAMKLMRVILERIDYDDLPPYDLEYVNAVHDAKNLEKWWRSVKPETKPGGEI